MSTNVWGTNKADIGEGFCLECEHADGGHYSNCITREQQTFAIGTQNYGESLALAHLRLYPHDETVCPMCLEFQRGYKLGKGIGAREGFKFGHNCK